MPNWVEQELFVVGPKLEVDQFVRTGFIRGKSRGADSVLDFTRLCPLKSRDRRDTYTHESGVVLRHFRTHTQVRFSIITSWDYPATFYARLVTHWPSLAFACAVNEDMGQFGGALMVLDGEVTNVVRDYIGGYDRRAHGREVRALLKRWGQFLTEARPWRLIPRRVWDHTPIPFDAHFDDDFWFYFRTREDLARFKGKYKSGGVMRRTDGEWKSARVRSV